MAERLETELWSKLMDVQQNIAEVKENVRHNEKAVDRVEQKLDILIDEVATKEELKAVSEKSDNLVWKLVIPAIAGIAGGITVRLLIQFLPN